MDENMNTERSATVKKVVSVIAFIMAMILILSIPVAAWFMTQKMLAAYAPISSPQSLYIGAGHIEFEGQTYYGNLADVDKYEDIRYLYLDSIDADEFTVEQIANEEDYYDFVFCVYGKGVGGFKIQLAYTTNNQFTYQIFNATESNATSAGAVPYTTHDATPQTYYYTVNGAAIAGSFLNDKTVNSETLGKTATDESEYAESLKYHKQTYGNYTNVQKYAEPIYWQTTNSQTGNLRGSFVNYYILRVSLNGKTTNDRETDVICIAAKST